MSQTFIDGVEASDFSRYPYERPCARIRITKRPVRKETAMASPADIQKFILKEAKKLDGVDDKEAKAAANICAKHIADYYKKNKDNGEAISKAIAQTKVGTYKGKDGKKHIKITSGELKCISKPIRSKLDNYPDDLKNIVGKAWAVIQKLLGTKWEEDAKKGNAIIGVRG